MMWVGLSGPVSNLSLAILLSLVLKIVSGPGFTYFLTIAALINIALAVVNLIPIPPLDGSRILTGLLPRALAYKYLKIEPFGFLIVFPLILLFGRWTIWPLIGIIASLLGLPLE